MAQGAARRGLDPKNKRVEPRDSSKYTEDRYLDDQRAADRRGTSSKSGRSSKSGPSPKSATRPTSKRKRGFFRRHAKGIAFGVFFPPLVLIAGLFWYASTIELPPDSTNPQTSFVYDTNGNELASFSAGEDRTDIALTDIPKVTRDAVLASEDRTFYSHRGVDPLGIVRAVYRGVRKQGVQQGGSTITQQYVKITYTGRERSYKRKVREAILAVKLEQRLSKDEILTRYLNSAYFGRGAEGIQAGARAHFDKDAANLTLAESAYLAGVLRSPENTDAIRNPEVALRRRDSVLSNMALHGLISEADRAVAAAVPLTGQGGIVRPKRALSRIAQPGLGAEYFVDAVRRELIVRFGPQKVFGGGLRVTTTFDPVTQRQARDAAFKQVLDREGDPQAAVVVLDHEGRVLAMVGGRDWNVSQVNLATGQGSPGRQAGSTFKPFVLAAAIREGISVESTFPAPAQVKIPGANVDGTDWTVSNFDDASFASDLTLATATANSVNTVYAELVTDERVGAQRVVDMAKDLGISSPLEAYPSIALGTEEVTPLEMARAYLTFAREGMTTETSLLVKVEDATGAKLFTPSNESNRVLSSDQAAVVNQTLRGVVSAGSGVRAQLSDGREVAGKTGTTQSARDAWFVGYTSKECCVVAIWMGYLDNKAMSKVHGRRVTGGAFPAQIFAAFMEAKVVGPQLDTGTFALPDENATGEVITPKRSSKPVKKPKNSAPATDVVTSEPLDGGLIDDAPTTEPVTEQAPPPVEAGPGESGGSTEGPAPVEAGNGTGSVETPTVTTPAPQPVPEPQVPTPVEVGTG